MNKFLETHNPTLCCGCSACVSKCPKRCITMSSDLDGFYIPIVTDKNACIDCGICSKVCPFENTKANPKTQEFYAAYSTTEDFIMNSSSGGIFPEIAFAFLKHGGIVYGAYMDEKFDLYHYRITDSNELQKIMRSKYFQSEIRGTYTECKIDLEAGLKVLFAGVPCQIQGLKNFLGKEYNNLFTIDIICHGVPSPLMFREYRDYLERKHKSKLVNLNFRDKSKFGWSVAMKYTMENKKGKCKEYVYNYHVSNYLMPFLNGYLTRESCYNCPFSSLARPGDITLGDFFGYHITRPELAHKEGLSLVLVNSAKGEELKQMCSATNVVMTKVTEYNVRMSGTRNLYSPTERPVNRDLIYTGLRSHGIDYLMKHFFEPKLTIRQKIRKFMPDYIIDLAKKILR